MNANIVSRIATAIAAFAAVGIVSGIAVPQAAPAQGLVEVYKGGNGNGNGNEQQGNYLFTRLAFDASGNYLFTNRISDRDGNYLFTNVICDPNGNYLFTNSQPVPVAPSDYGLVVPLSGSVTKHTTGGYGVTIEGKSGLAAITDGNYLFAFGTDGNYLFTNSANGLLSVPGGWSMDRGGNIICAPSKPHNGMEMEPDAPTRPNNRPLLVGESLTTPEGYTFSRNKNGSRSLTLPSGDVYLLSETVEMGMDPAGLYYD